MVHLLQCVWGMDFKSHCFALYVLTNLTRSVCDN